MISHPKGQTFIGLAFGFSTPFKGQMVKLLLSSRISWEDW